MDDVRQGQQGRQAGSLRNGKCDGLHLKGSGKPRKGPGRMNWADEHC